MKVCGMDIGEIKDTIYFEGKVWTSSHNKEGWLELDCTLPEEAVVVFEGRCASLEAVLGHRDLRTIAPGRSAKIMRAFDEAKDDKRDAKTLADIFFLRPKTFKRIQVRDEDMQRLRDLSRARRTLVGHRTAVLQQLGSARRREKGESRKDWLASFAGSAQESLVAVLKVMDEEISSLEEQLASEGERNACCKTFRTIKGMGEKLSAEITAEMEGFVDFESKEQAQKYAGTAPVTISSGNRRFVRSRKRCNHRARNALYLFAFCSMRFHSWAREYYDRCRERGKSHDAALISLANRWVPILFAMAKHGQSYDPTRKENKYSA